MKKPLLLLLIFIMFINFNFYSSANIDNITNNKREKVEVKPEKFKLSDLTDELIKEYNIDIHELVKEEYMILWDKKDTCEDKEAWFLEYKYFVDKYYDEIEDPPETIYDCFTEYEIDLFQKVVEAEVGDLGGFIEKANVACAILNRIEEEKFHNVETLGDALTPEQFTTIRNGRINKVSVSEQTKLACEYAFQIEDTVDMAVFFESGESNVHESYAEHVMTDNAGHKFYKIKKEE